MVIGIKLIDDRTNHVNGKCIACIKENIIPKRFDIENPKKLYRIYSNIYRLFDIEGYFQSQYFMTFVDGFLHYVRVKPIRSKDETCKVLKE